MEEVMGRNGLNALLNLTGLEQYKEQFPPNNLDKEFDFADFSSLNQGLYDIYGPRGARGLGLRGGRATFDQGLKDFGALAGVGDFAFKILPLGTKLRIGPVCWQLESDAPVCFVAAGLLQEGLRWVSGGHSFHVSEINCLAVGDSSCIFKIDKEPLD
jgi:hypothetical protein